MKFLNIQFVWWKKLVYYRDLFNFKKRFYIFKSIKQKIFELTYDFQNYNDFHKIYERIIKSYYMRHLIRRLKRYILHYPQY